MMTVSVIICTYNRGEHLEKCLRSLEALRYPMFEVIVVNGPSGDSTRRVLASYSGRLKVQENRDVNLSVSRNLGIDVAEGSICAFIDDDAVPLPDWLDRIVANYSRGVGGVGGRVLGPGADHVQFQNGTINEWGIADAIRLSGAPPKRDSFPIMMGVNSSFLRSALQEVGGFDEYFDYFHDESDVCVRLRKAGYEIRYEPMAIVIHDFARGHLRRSTYQMNWYPIVKNTVYFALKNADGSTSIRIMGSLRSALRRIREWIGWRRRGLISQRDMNRFCTDWVRGVANGLRDGLRTPRRTRARWVEGSCGVPLARFRGSRVPKDDPRSLRVAIVTRDYSDSNIGGIARYSRILAEGLARRGHHVTVLTGDVNPSGCERNGVVLARPLRIEDRLSSVPVEFGNAQRCLQWSVGVAKRIRDFDPDIVEFSNWDFEGFGVVNTPSLRPKTVIRLVSPLRHVMKAEGWEESGDLNLMCELERETIMRAPHVISSTVANWQAILDGYGISRNKHIDIVPFGVVDPGCVDLDGYDENSILFVGRLERRKGVSTLLNAFRRLREQYPRLLLTCCGRDVDGFASERLEGVQFLGFVDDSTLDRLYRRCNFVVFPSTYESFGFISVEAMMRGKPVIATRVGGIPEVVREGETGLLVESGNVDALARSMAELVSDRQRRNRMGALAREYAVTHLSVDTFIDRSLEVYGQVCHINRLREGGFVN